MTLAWIFENLRRRELGCWWLGAKMWTTEVKEVRFIEQHCVIIEAYSSNFVAEGRELWDKTLDVGEGILIVRCLLAYFSKERKTHWGEPPILGFQVSHGYLPLLLLLLLLLFHFGYFLLLCFQVLKSFLLLFLIYL
jgi:hypothetical protein